MSIEQMRNKLLEWNPTWNVDRFDDQQIRAIYFKESTQIAQDIINLYNT